MSKEIKLAGGEITIIDDDVFEWARHMRWHLGAKRYAAKHAGPGRKAMLHNLIMNPPEGLVVDHINGDYLDNRRENLRVCTPKENLQNKTKRPPAPVGHSQYRGVTYFCPKRKRYLAKCGGKSLGWFKTDAEAAEAYDDYAAKEYGEFANLNFPLRHPEARPKT